MQLLPHIIYSLSLFFGMLYVLLILFYITGWINTKKYISSSPYFSTAISIIVPARNEANYIGDCLNALLKQDYPKNLYEIIVVDDDSADNTAAIVEAIQKNCTMLHLIRLKDELGITSYKKRAIATAIKQSKGKLIVTTDADSIVGNKWLSTLVSFYEEKKPKMIVAPVLFTEEKNAFEKMQSLEFTGLMGVTAGAIYYRMPIMCNGANLAYEKSAFEVVKGFDNIDNIASGDDVLLMHKMHHTFPKGVRYVKSTDAIVYTRSAPTLSDFIHQRIRWASKAKAYNSFLSFASGIIVFGFNFLLLIILLLSVLYNGFGHLFLLLFATKSLVDFLLLHLSSSFFRKNTLLVFFIPEQLLYSIYITFVGFFSTLGKYRWKGRRIK